MAAILNSAILDSAILHKTLTQTNSIWLKLIHSHLTWWWQPSWILPSWIQPFCTKLWLKLFILTQLDDISHLVFCHFGFSHLHKKKTSLIHSDSNLDDGSHLEFYHLGFSHCHLGFRHLVKIHSKHFTPPWLWLKLIQSDLNSSWWWQPSWILPSWIQTLPSWIQTPC